MFGTSGIIPLLRWVDRLRDRFSTVTAECRIGRVATGGGN